MSGGRWASSGSPSKAGAGPTRVLEGVKVETGCTERERGRARGREAERGEPEEASENDK